MNKPDTSRTYKVVSDHQTTENGYHRVVVQYENGERWAGEVDEATYEQIQEYKS